MSLDAVGIVSKDINQSVRFYGILGVLFVDALYYQITESRFKSLKSPWDAFWGQGYSSVLDPDGNQVDIFAAL